MINLNEIANKVSEILNSVDNPLRIDNERVIFDVATEGYRVDSIAKREEGKNAIIVFIALAGGENQPIPSLKQQSKSISIAVFYPIEYKEIFFDLEDYLDDVFVGKQLDFGTLTGTCLCNMGVAQYGDIQGLDLQQFESMVSNKYKKTIETSGNWHSMMIQLFVTRLANGFMFGNDVKYALELNYKNIEIAGVRIYDDGDNTLYNYSSSLNKSIDGKIYFGFLENEGQDEIYCLNSVLTISGKCDYLSLNVTFYKYDATTQKMTSVASDRDYQIVECVIRETDVLKTVAEEITWSSSGTGANISPIAEQRIGIDKFAKNVANITNYNKSILVFLKPSTDFGVLLITLYNIQRLDLAESLKLIKQYSNGYKYVTNQIALTINENVALGEPLSFTLTFGDKK